MSCIARPTKVLRAVLRYGVPSSCLLLGAHFSSVRYLQLDEDQSKSFLESTKTEVNSYWTTAGEALEELQKSSMAKLAVPQYVQLLPGFVAALRESFSFKAGSMGHEVVREGAKALKAQQQTTVRIGHELCDQELKFLEQRKQFTKRSLARYLSVPVETIHKDDIPIIGVATSGGGLRACLSATAYYEIMQKIGLLEVTTYIAGVSGSTWAQALLYNSSIGQQNATSILNHLKSRIDVHIADPIHNLEVLQDPITCKYVLRGLFERYHAGYDDIGLTDLYGLMLANRLFITKDALKMDDADLLLSAQVRYLDEGQFPMPLYSCVRHDVPEKVKKEVKEEQIDDPVEQTEKLKEKSYFQHYEFSPFEFGSEDTGAWIPMSAVGTRFRNGKSTGKQPEIKLTTLLGTFSSAFCASLSAYIQEAESLVPMESVVLSMLKQQIVARDEDLKAIKLVDATKIPNYALGLDLGPTVPKHMSEIADLELCDAGMSNNLPFYPLLRRNCDIIIAIDASADIETTPWFSRTEAYARRKNLQCWPLGITWPKDDGTTQQGPEPSFAEIHGGSDKEPVSPREKKLYELDGVNVWVGRPSESASVATTGPNDKLQAQMVSNDWETVSASSGLMLIYLPLLPNDKAPGIDPKTSEHLSTWNFVYTEEQVEGLRQLANANFDEDRVKCAVRAMYLRKKKERLALAVPTI